MIFNYNTISFRCSFFPGCGPSSVIEIVKVKYNRIDIKMWLVSTSFIINIEIFSNFYITYMIFNYNTISFRCSFVPVLVKGLYQTASCSLHVMQLVRIYVFKSHKAISICIRWGEGEIYQIHQSVLFSCWVEVAIVHSKY